MLDDIFKALSINRDFWLKAIFVIIVITLVCLFIRMIVLTIRQNRHFDIRKVTLNDKWVYEILEDYAYDIVEKRYNQLGKPITTKKDELRVNYVKDANKQLQLILKECCNGTKFSRHFCNYVEQKYPEIRVKDFRNVIDKYLKRRKKQVQNEFNNFVNEMSVISVNEFMKLKQQQKGDMVGVYVIYNENRNMYYVGQAKKLFFRINQHFTGHGNGDVYADYKIGNNFKIMIIPLSDSGYKDIDLLEKDMIQKYNAYECGYNKTKGND